jgi:hypothetical protein
MCAGGDIQGVKNDERHYWRWTPTTNQDVNVKYLDVAVSTVLKYSITSVWRLCQVMVGHCFQGHCDAICAAEYAWEHMVSLYCRQCSLSTSAYVGPTGRHRSAVHMQALS